MTNPLFYLLSLLLAPTGSVTAQAAERADVGAPALIECDGPASILRCLIDRQIRGC